MYTVNQLLGNRIQHSGHLEPLKHALVHYVSVVTMYTPTLHTNDYSLNPTPFIPANMIKNHYYHTISTFVRYRVDGFLKIQRQLVDDRQQREAGC